MIVGLTGRMASGKGTVAECLKELGFVFWSLSDEIRYELKHRGLLETREALTTTGNELRLQFGASVLADRVLAKLNKSDHYVIDSIRNPAEVVALRGNRSDFRLWYVDADPELRFERLRLRGRIGDVRTAAEFRAQEERELETDNPTTQQLRATEALADRRISNNSDENALRIAVFDALREEFGFVATPV